MSKLRMIVILGAVMTLSLVSYAQVPPNIRNAGTVTPGTPTPPGCELPMGWVYTDIGSGQVPGSGCETGGVYTITASGGIFGVADQGGFAYQEQNGDFQITFRVVSVGPTSGLSDGEQFAAGIVRLTTDEGSPFGQTIIDRNGQASANWRLVQDGSSDLSSASGATWGKVRVQSGVVDFAYSNDGSLWFAIGIPRDIGADSDYLIGLSCFNTDDTLLTACVFDNVTIEASVPDDEAEDTGMVRPDMPPVPGADTRHAFTVDGSPEIWVLNTLNPSTGASSCTGTCSGAFDEAVCDTATCFTTGWSAFWEASNSRILVCTVSGNIDLGSGDTLLHMTSPYVWIALQTCPSPGITVIEAGGHYLRNTAHDVWIQHLRLRGGATGTRSHGWHDGIGIFHDDSSEGANVHSVVFDHLSIAWSGNKQVIMGGSGWMTMWRSLIGEALYYALNFVPPCSDGNPNVCEEPAPTFPSGKEESVSGLNVLTSMSSQSFLDRTSSIIENVFTNAPQRNPETQRGVWNNINNIFHGWGHSNDSYSGAGYSSANFFYCEGCINFTWKANIVGNKYISSDSTIVYGPLCAIGTWDGNGDAALFINGNEIDDAEESVTEFCQFFMGRDARVFSPVVSLGDYTPRDAEDLESFLLPKVGARPLDRDSVDERLIDDVINRTGRLFNSHIFTPEGGFPSLATNTTGGLNVPANPFAASGDRTAIEDALYACARSIEDVTWSGATCR